MRPEGADGGYVTLAVLAVSGLLAALVSALLMVARPAIDLARLGADDLAAEALLEGGLVAAGYLLFTAERSPEAANGTSLRFNTGSVALAVRDESGRVDLNGAGAEMLAGLFTAAGGTSLSPQAFAARVIDWRDPDSDRGDDGAEAGDYATGGVDYGPRNGPFRSVSELRLLLGLSARDFARIAVHATVFSGSATIAAFSAGPVALSAVPNLSRGDAEQIRKAAAGGVAERAALGPLLEPFSQYLRGEPSGVYRVTIEARLRNGMRERAEAVIMRAQETPAGYSVLAWSPLPASPPTP